MGYVTRQLGFMTRKWTAPTVRKKVQALLDKWCESYEWDQKAALDAGDLVRLRRIKVRAALASELLEPFGLKVADKVGIIHIGEICVRVDLKLAAPDLGFFSKPWQVTVEDVDVVLELVKAGFDHEVPPSTALPSPPQLPAPLSDRSGLSGDEAAVMAEAPGQGLSCRFVTLTVAPGDALGVTLANAETSYTAAKVTELTPGGVAEQSELLELGDLVSCVNGRRVRTHKEAVQALAFPPASSLALPKGCVRLLVLRSAPASSASAAEGSSSSAPEAISQPSAGETSSSIRRAMENLKLVIKNVRVRVRGSEPGDALEFALGEAKVVSTDGSWQELRRMSVVHDGDLVFKRVSIANLVAHSESLDVRQAARTNGAGTLVRKRVVDLESADVRICKRLQAQAAHPGTSLADHIRGAYYELTSELLARRPTLLVPPFKSSLTYDEPTAAYRFDVHGDLALQLSHALHSTELLELSQWWTRLNAGRWRAGAGASGSAEESLLKERRWRKAAEAALRQARVVAREDRASLEAAEARCKELEAHLLRQSETLSRLLLGVGAHGRDGAAGLEEMRVLLLDFQRSNKAVLGAPSGDPGVDMHPQSHGFLLATEEGPGNFVRTVYATEDEAREAARATWVSYVLYDLAVPWQPREIGDGGIGFGHAAIRAYVEEEHRLTPRASVSRAEGAPEYEVA